MTCKMADSRGANGTDNPLAMAAQAYAKRGWAVLPLHNPTASGCSCRDKSCDHTGKHPRTKHGGKDARVDPDTLKAWWAKWPDASIGIQTGSASGVIVIDIDDRHGGFQSLERLEKIRGALPKCPAVHSGGGGRHLYFAAPDFLVKNKVSIEDGIDIRGDGGYIVGPPSLHAGGKHYCWVDGLDLDQVPLPPLPDWLQVLLLTGRRRKNTKQPGRIPEGRRNARLASMAGTMRRRGLSETAIAAALKVTNAELCAPPLPEVEVSAVATSIARYPVGPDIEEIGLVKPLADAILLSNHFAQDAGGRLYRYEGGVYRPDGSQHVKRQVKRLLEDWGITKRWSSHRSEEVIEYLRIDAPALWDRPPLDVVNLLNGLLDIKNQSLLVHSPQHLSSVQLPVNHDPAATCPEWDRFVGQVFPGDAQDVAFEIPACLMTPEKSTQQAILLLGDGANGKSTYLSGLTAFLGRGNVSNVSLQKLESDRFAAARLVGKLANVCPDLPSAHLVGTSVFKSITGGDRISAEYKYKDLFDFEPFARLVFSANAPPRSGDPSMGFFRRWLVVPFTRTFEGQKAIPRSVLDARLFNPQELSGLLNKALAALRRIQRRGRFTESKSMVSAREEFRTATDPLAAWMERFTVQGAALFVTKRALLAAYNCTPGAEGRPAMTETAFGLALRRVHPGLESAQRVVAGKKQWCWVGLGLKQGQHE
jgi:putative DNA primase/helicase